MLRPCLLGHINIHKINSSRKVCTLIFDWLVWMSPKRDYLRLVSFKHESRKERACRCAGSVANCIQRLGGHQEIWNGRGLTDNYVTRRTTDLNRIRTQKDLNQHALEIKGRRIGSGLVRRDCAYLLLGLLDKAYAKPKVTLVPETAVRLGLGGH